MSRLSLSALVLVSVAVTLAGCITPTATPTPAPTTAPATGLPPTGYPAAAPSNTAAATGYPAATAGPTQPPAAYPADPSATGPAASATTAATDGPAATATPAPTDTLAPTPTSGPVFITYRNFEIVPASTTVKAGTLVTFIIEGDKHQPYAGAAAPFIFEAPADLQNTTWSITFNNARTMTILCGYHGNMTATLIVEP
jgi:plastocyanin